MKLNVANIKFEVPQQASKQTSFKGGSYAASRELTKQIANNSTKGIKFLTNLGKNNGEILNTIVTAIGTACVAPIFIAFNPFSKEDKDTKVYSAMRQPISAVIALVTQIGVNKKFNSWLDKLASTGQLDRANLLAKPQASYLKKIIKKENPTNYKENFSSLLENKQDNAFWDRVNELRESMKSQNIDLKDLIDSNDYKSAKKTVEKKFADDISKMNKKEAAKFIDTESTKMAIETLNRNIQREAKAKFNIAKYAKGNESLDTVRKNITDSLNLLEKNIALAGRQATQAENLQLKELEYTLHKLNKITDFAQVKNLGSTFEEVLQSVKIKKYVKAGINNAEEVLKSSKKWGGIFLSLATLPFSCGLLNWAYPRIMEKLMPEASAAKKAKEAK